MKSLRNLFIYILINALCINILFAQNDKDANKNYLPNTIIFKIKPEYKSEFASKSTTNITLNSIFNQIKTTSFDKKFPQIESPSISKNLNGKKLVDLSLIYEIKYEGNIPVQEVAKRISSLDFIEYAVPYVLPKTLFSPNDPYFSYQTTYLNLIKLTQSWDIEDGDTNVVIGLIDTGTDIDHSDLVDNIKYNYADPIDGEDNDNDGFLDNYRGWDLADDDNDPQTFASHHGVDVSGVISASTNNINAVAGVGYKCKFLPVKVMDAAGDITKGYEGIVYAVDHGCKIINCSWGSELSAGQFGQDIINYAVINNNAVVVAACGNDAKDIKYYPAAYDNVLSVASTDNLDVKYSTSNYNHSVDICAPGKNIVTTSNGESLKFNFSGTSASTAIVSGCAALLRSHFPNYNALQIMEQLKVTSDSIDTIGTNENYTDKLGAGRINIYRALTDTSFPSIVMSNLNITDNGDNIFATNDYVFITFTLTDYLAAIGNLSVTISTTSPYISAITPTVSYGAFTTLQSKNSPSNFVLRVLPNAPLNEVVHLKFTYTNVGSGAAYSESQYADFIINLDYLNVDTNNVNTTVTGDGRIGYFDYPDKGYGFTYEGSESILREATLIIGSSVSNVSDNVTGVSSSDSDFVTVSTIREDTNASSIADFVARGKFNDDSAGASKLNLEVLQNVYAYADDDNSDYVIFEYYIINKGVSVITSLYAGMFADWNIGDKETNSSNFDEDNNISYTYGQNGDDYAGVVLLTEGTIKSYAIGGSGGGINFDDGFSESEKYTALSTNLKQSLEGDMKQVTSTGPYNLYAGDTLEVAFALVAGHHLLTLQSHAIAAKSNYTNRIKSSINELDKTSYNSNLNIYPSPVANNMFIEFDLNQNSRTTIDICNAMGESVLNISDKKLSKGKQSINADLSELNNGIYFCRVKTNYNEFIKKIVVVH